MGIHGLTTRIASHGHWHTWERPLQGHSQTPPAVAIIDGPSLAHHMLSEHRAASRNIDSTPVYSEIARRTIAFLEDMEAIDLRIHAILFDGALPTAKFDTREKRTTRRLDALATAKQYNRLVGPGSFFDPPFFVSSVIEALRDSRFAAVTKVVAGEADAYCAVVAQDIDDNTENTVAIISDDSDLVVQPCGRRTRVILLRGLERHRLPQGIKVAARVFCPAELARIFGLPDLLIPAFFMSKELDLSFYAAVAKARSCVNDQPREIGLLRNPEYDDFVDELEGPYYDTDVIPVPAQRVLKQMDPRIAELAHQMMPGYPRPADSPPRIYLVSLNEDIGRACAWNCGQEVRHTAYQMVEVTIGRDQNICEYTRKGQNMSKLYVEPSLEWKTNLLRYSQELQTTKNYLLGQAGTPAQQFKYLGMYYAIQEQAKKGMNIPYASLMGALVRGSIRSLEDLNLLAMCQAAIYSFRILKQFLALEKALKNGLEEELSLLEQLLGEMPPLAEVMEKSEKDTEEFWGNLAPGLIGTVDWS